MDENDFARVYSKSSMESEKDNQASKRRKAVEKTVVRVRIVENAGKVECPPSDTWSWRKYGQKPIKGSPYPRGYYRCSTTKGCSAKKQVERCRSDGSIFIITYTSAHNHTSLHTHINNSTHQPLQFQPITDTPTTAPDPPINEKGPNVNSHCQSPIKSPLGSSHDSQPAASEKAHNNSLSILHDKHPSSFSGAMAFSTPKLEENDFFDELEDLPISSSFTSLMTTGFFDERILA